ncbi:hypothetical protein ACIBO2_04335 [Nonomuraea sp. NPDC050022]
MLRQLVMMSMSGLQLPSSAISFLISPTLPPDMAGMVMGPQRTVVTF